VTAAAAAALVVVVVVVVVALFVMVVVFRGGENDHSSRKLLCRQGAAKPQCKMLEPDSADRPVLGSFHTVAAVTVVGEVEIN